MARQLPLALSTAPAVSRDDFIVTASNAEAVAFIDSWPRWSVSSAALVGPAGCGKSHLGLVWANHARATLVDARRLDDQLAARVPAGPVLIDNVDQAAPAERDGALFSIFNRGEPTLLIGRQPSADWPVLLPDLASRFRALLVFPLWAPDDALLAALAQKLFADRQLHVGTDVVDRMIASLERSPASIREFVERIDREALAQKRRITLGLVRELLPERP